MIDQVQIHLFSDYDPYSIALKAVNIFMDVDVHQH